MKKVKLLSVLVIILSVVALGALAGKKFFVYLEANASPAVVQGSGKPASEQASSGAKSAGSVPPALSAPSQAELTAKPVGEEKLSGSPNPSTVTPLRGASPGGLTPVKVETAAVPPAAIPAGSGKEIGKPADQVQPTAAPLDASSVDFSKTKWIAFAGGDGVNVRENPETSKNSKVIMKVSKGTKGTVLEKKNGWTKIKWDFNKKIGWTRDDIIVSGPEEVLQSAGTDGEHVASMTSGALQAASRKAAEIAKTVNVAVARPVPASETVKGFFGGKPPSDATIVASPYARIRSQPTRQASEVGRIPKGIAVKIKSYKQMGKFAWFEITFNNGKKEGWTREDNLRF